MDLKAILEFVQTINNNLLLKQILIMVVYILMAKVADLLIDRVLKKLADRTELDIDNYLIDILHTPICWSIFWFGVLHVLVIRSMKPPWESVLPAAAKSAILVFWIIAFIRVFNKLVEERKAKVLLRGKIGDDLFLLLKNIIRVVVFVAGILWLLAIWKLDLTPLFASAGIVGIAVALAAKDTLANFFGGISIFADKTFKVGDYIILDNNERGEVVEIGIRSTRIKTRDDILITIPNSILASSKIINESAPVPRFRIRVPVGVSYGTDLDKVEEILLRVAKANENVVPEPEPRVRLRRFGESSVDFELLCWVDDPSLKGLETHNLLKATYQLFGSEGVTIPFPQRDVHIIKHSNSGLNESGVG